jgi:hypothetical protein
LLPNWSITLIAQLKSGVVCRMYVHPRLAADSDLRHTWLSLLSESDMAVQKEAKAGDPGSSQQAKMLKGEKSAQVEAPAASAEDPAPLRNSLIRAKAAQLTS